jgi:CrcB protein
MAYWAVFLGGGLGSVSRYAWGRALAAGWSGPGWLAAPAATAAVNLAATALLVFLLTRGEGPATGSRWTSHAWLLATTGFCGGFSTFSTFAADTIKLYTTGHPQWAVANVAINVLGCLAVALWGMGWKLGS